MRRGRRVVVATAVALSAAVIVTGVAACGDDQGEGSAAATAATTGSAGPMDASAVDAMFAADMVPHHEDAIAMARIAQERAEHAEIRRLADAIITSQQAEIALLEEEAATLPAAEPSGDHMMDMADIEALETAQPFDEAFIDAMIPHHDGAIMMARMQLAGGADPELTTLAREIVREQSREIDEMQEWREEWYGARAPAGHDMGGHAG